MRAPGTTPYITIMSTGTLLLVDGTGVAYRAFYAIAELSTRDGRPTNAVFGFIKMLQQLQQVWKPTHWAVVFDGGLPEERMAALATYKAQRPPMPDALRGQFAGIEEFLAGARVASLRVDKQEADDVIATLVAQGAAADMNVLMASSDKDLYQLVNERVRVIPPSKAGSPMGAPEVLEKTGVPPEQIVAWLALTGDSVDNVPGVPGVGPKTAAKLLGEYGSLDGIRANMERVSSAKLKESLQAHWADVERNRELVRLRCDLSLGVDIGSLRVRQPDHVKLLAFYESMEFKSLAAGAREALEQGPMLDFG